MPNHTYGKNSYLFVILLAIVFISTIGHAAPSNNQAIFRVGTTGDYPPLTSFNESKNQYEGFDIELTNMIAILLNLKIEFVRTSWPTLGQDLENNKFDIAVGGISINKARAKQFLFTTPILENEKVAIFRCSDKSIYTSIESINEPNVRVIVNPGGTNEQFAKKQFPNANIIIFNDNTKIFNQIIESAADVMATDLLEAKFQMKSHPELCFNNFRPEDSDRTYKAYMLRNNSSEVLLKINKALTYLDNKGFIKGLKGKWL